MGVPYHESTGEAEAECARLQQLGVVDAFSLKTPTPLYSVAVLF